MNEGRSVVVQFQNGINMIIHGCTKYEINWQCQCFFIYKNHERIMLPTSNVLFIGYEDAVFDAGKEVEDNVV